MILIFGFTGPPTIHFKFITKCDSFFVTKCDSYWDRYYKERQKTRSDRFARRFSFSPRSTYLGACSQAGAASDENFVGHAKISPTNTICYLLKKKKKQNKTNKQQQTNKQTKQKKL